jgi:hypothetical protein
MARQAKDPPVSYQTLVDLVAIKSDHQIAREFGVTHSGVMYWRQKYGIVREYGKTGRYRRWSLDETFFDCLDSEVKAYVLGLIVSDGSLDPKNMGLVIQLKATDRVLLESVRQAMGSDRPLLKIPSPLGFNGGPQTRFVVQSQYLFRALLALGLTPNKSLTTTYPPVPHNLDRHFCRGLWDGDGYVGIRQGQLVGTQDLLNGVAERVQDHLGVSLRVFPHGPIFTLSVGRKTRAVIQWLYDNPQIVLPRKYAVVKEHWL